MKTDAEQALRMFIKHFNAQVYEYPEYHVTMMYQYDGLGEELRKQWLEAFRRTLAEIEEFNREK